MDVNVGLGGLGFDVVNVVVGDVVVLAGGSVDETTVAGAMTVGFPGVITTGSAITVGVISFVVVGEIAPGCAKIVGVITTGRIVVVTGV